MALVVDGVTFNLIVDSSVRVCAAVSTRDDLSVVEYDVGVCVEITRTNNVSLVWIEVGVSTKTG